MAFKFNLADKVEAVLEEHGQSMAARAIAERIWTKYPEDCREKVSGSARSGGTDKKWINRIAGEIRNSSARWGKRGIVIVSRDPIVLGLSESKGATGEGVTKTAKGGSARKGKNEKGLYPKLLDFLKSERVRAKIIKESRSSNKRGKRGNQWLHPDVVGMRDLSKGWDRELLDCAKDCGELRAELWSFEVKAEITRSSLRQDFFQAVSNSSWANFGYLVASEMKGGEETMNELRILSNLHGIGFIRLNRKDPAQSQILLQARKRDGVDWDTANRIFKENADFQEYMSFVRSAFGGPGGLDKHFWDN
ncbi:MAG: HrgA protein [Alphaproteobacteria bacterium]|nr:HrgA protein [Alphaproteobacteria bacterium]